MNICKLLTHQVTKRTPMTSLIVICKKLPLPLNQLLIPLFLIVPIWDPLLDLSSCPYKCLRTKFCCCCWQINSTNINKQLWLLRFLFCQHDFWLASNRREQQCEEWVACIREMHKQQSPPTFDSPDRGIKFFSLPGLVIILLIPKSEKIENQELKWSFSKSLSWADFEKLRKFRFLWTMT